MKKLFFGVMAIIAMMFTANSAAAQMPQPCPIDSAVRVGKLDNGLTYYIRHNEKPKGQADFFIAQKVGSILEEDNQRGLAHFLEHMCFNGTTSFPGNSLIDWLGTVGVKFGYNLNAYTGTDETVYNISSVPVARTSVQDSCLLILHDWANDLTLDGKEIDSERGVIHEEWRRSNVGQMRILESLLPTIYPGSKYGVRLPIGTMEVVDNFEHQALRDYYHKWYRPDNQAIIVVGDIDVDYIEGKIKELFAGIKMPENPAERTYEQVPDNNGTIYAIGTDKEMSYPIASYYFKIDGKFVPDEIRSTPIFFQITYFTDMIERMLNQRLNDLSAKPEATFAHGSVSLGNFLLAVTRDAVSFTVVGKGDDIRPAFKDVYRELLRALRYGFTESEYERAKAQYLASMEQSYNERDARTNTSYCREYAANFTKLDPIPGIEYEYEFAKALTNGISYDQINAVAAQLVQGSDNRVLLAMLPENDTYHVPTEAEMAEAIAAVEAEDIEGYKDDVKSEPLIPSLPKAATGKVSQDKQWDATKVVYPNGATVFIKSTKFKEGEILFNANAKGGQANIDITAPTSQFLGYALSQNSLGTYTNSDLRKYLQGKQTQLSAGVDDYMRYLSGSTTNKNAQTLMELIYMSFTDLHLDATEYEGLQNRLIAMLANQESTPDFVFGKGVQEDLYAAAAQQQISSASIKSASVDESNTAIKQMFANPGDFTFTFVGDIDIDTFLPLVNQYIGSLKAPRIAGISYAPNADWEVRNGNSTNQDKMAMETPQTTVAIVSTAKVTYNYTNRTIASIIGQILTKRLLNKIREEMGAVYSISASAYLERLGDKNYTLISQFPMKPEMKDEVLAEIHKLYYSMAENITDDELSPVKEFMTKSVKESIERNEGWLNAISGASLNGVDVLNGAEEAISKITVADVKAFVKQVLDQNNYRVYLLEPETK